jgi:L-rhamnose mutarotase
MQRIGFRTKVNAKDLDAYIEAHKNVWPDMKAALTETGWHNYSLFIDRNDGTMFGYFETPDVNAAFEKMAVKEVNDRWQAYMSQYFEANDGKRPDEGFLLLEQVFYLD